MIVFTNNGTGSGDINQSRARHADEIKDSVDVEIIVGNTDRIGTNDMLLSMVRASIMNHGASNTKVVATHIDASTPACPKDFD